jgi:hypothetical protein
METLSKIFGGEIKVKLMKLFLFNGEEVLDVATIIRRVRSDSGKVKRELSGLEKMKMIKRKVVYLKTNNKTKNKKNKSKGQKIIAYSLNKNFPYMRDLQNFLLNLEPLQPKEIVKKLMRLGSVKVVLVAGVFIQDPESRLDLLIVGDRIRTAGLETTIKNLEAEIGRELKYAYFTTEDFKYRISMYDKLTRDVFDYPHKMVVDKLGLN